MDKTEELMPELNRIKKIVEKEIWEYQKYMKSKESLPELLELSRQVREDALWRAGKTIKEFGKQDCEKLERELGDAVEKAVRKLLFYLKDQKKDVEESE